MNTKLLEQFKKGEVILYTPTFEDFKALMEWCDTQNIKWNDGDRTDEKMKSVFNLHNHNSQGIIANNKEITYCTGFIQPIRIIAAKDLEPDKQTFTKDDLKIGMIVEIACEDRFVVYQDGRFPNVNTCLEWINDNDYNYDLTRKFNNNNRNITKVYTTNNLISVLEGNYDSLELVWERDAFDWSIIAVDTKILVSNDNKNFIKAHFAEYINRKVYAWAYGNTSFTCDQSRKWEYTKLYKEDESSI